MGESPTCFKTEVGHVTVGMAGREDEMGLLAYKMQLKPGCKVEYKKRHEKIWPELEALFQTAGVSDYSIFLDEETNTLFARLRCVRQEDYDRLPEAEVLQRWWSWMAPLMETEPESVQPRVKDLELMFYLP